MSDQRSDAPLTPNTAMRAVMEHYGGRKGLALDLQRRHNMSKLFRNTKEMAEAKRKLDAHNKTRRRRASSR